jgi:hypothetical protein
VLDFCLAALFGRVFFLIEFAGSFLRKEEENTYLKRRDEGIRTSGRVPDS